jgi:hypothetical protein
MIKVAVTIDVDQSEGPPWAGPGQTTQQYAAVPAENERKQAGVPGDTYFTGNRLIKAA